MITAVYFQARPVWCFQSLYVPTGAVSYVKFGAAVGPPVASGQAVLGLADWADRNSESAARLLRGSYEPRQFSGVGHVPLVVDIQ